MTDQRAALTPEELEAVAVLAKRHRLLVLLVPVGIPTAKVQQLTRETSARLEALAALDVAETHEHGPLSWRVTGWACDTCGAFPVEIRT